MIAKILLLALLAVSVAAFNPFGSSPSRSCGKALVRRINELCNQERCSTGLDIASLSCSTPVTDDELHARCCPDSERAQEIEKAREEYLATFDFAVAPQKPQESAVPSEKAYKSCGRSLVRRVFKICPEGCNPDHQDVATAVCGSPFTDSALKQRCCPEPF